MKLNDFLKEVHENAVAHGWWETDRSIAEIIVLILNRGISASVKDTIQELKEQEHP